jgi:hypothetical protein
MTIAASEPQKVTVNGNDVATSFSFSPMIIYEADDLLVTHVSTAGVETVLTEGVGATNYTVVVSAYPGTGSITYPSTGATRLATGEKLVLKSVLATEQTLDLENQGGYFPDLQEIALDKVVKLHIQQQEELDRSLRLPISVSAAVSKELEIPSADKLIGWNATATALVNKASAGTITVSPFMETVLDDANAEAARDTLYGDTVKGDVVLGTGAGLSARLTVGANDSIPVAASGETTGWAWKTVAASLLALLTTKGDMIVRTASAAVRKAVGADGKVLAADSNDTDGIKYVNVAGPGFHGVVRSHADSDVVNSKIRADLSDVTLNDGHYYNPAQGLIFDKAVTGSIGGMQAAAVNSTWNKLYYARKRSDGSEGLWGLRAKNYGADQSFVTATNATRNLRIATATATDKLAQGFQVTTAGKLEFIDFIPQRNNSPTGNFWITIESDTAGSPSGTVLATSDKYDVSRISASADIYIRMPFRVPATLSAATQYHWVVQGDYTKSDTVNIALRGVAAGGYANGSAKEFNGSVWGAASGVGDFDFKLYVTQNDTALALPAGYDQYVQIGWFYINGSGNIIRFKQQDRNYNAMPGIATNGIVATVTSTAAILSDLSAFIPPIPALVTFGLSSSIASVTALIGGLADTNLVNGATVNGQIQLITVSGSGTGAPNIFFPPAAVEYQAANFMTFSDTSYYWLAGFTW